MLSDQELKQIDDWRFAKRVGTRAGAIRRLLQIGIAFGEVAEQMNDISSDLMDYDPDIARILTNPPTPGSAEHLQKQWELIKRFTHLYNLAFSLSREGDFDALLRKAKSQIDDPAEK